MPPEQYKTLIDKEIQKNYRKENLYQATVTSGRGGQEENYVGLAADFKRRYYKHKESLTVKNPKGSTTLSTHFWKEKEDGEDHDVSWKILEANISTFNPVTRTCNLREKYNIVFNPHLVSLNSRHEIFAHCRHMDSKLIGKPPD